MVNLEESTTECNDKDLKNDDDEDNDAEKFTFQDTLKQVQFILDLPTAQEVENLQENKSIEDESKMATVVVVLLEPFQVTVLAIDIVKPSICNSTLSSVEIFCFKVRSND